MTRLFHTLSKLPFCVFIVLFSCRTDVSSPQIGDAVASPIATAVNKDGNYFYILNSDSAHDYSTGSILVLDKEGKKSNAVKVPRLGKSMSVSGDQLFVTFDHESDVDEDSMLRVYNIKDPENPSEIKSWPLNASESCSPANVVSREGCDYFFVSCVEGDLYVGDIKNTFFKKVRSYPVPLKSARKVMYIDVARDLLYLFISDIVTGSLSDEVYPDAQKVENGALVSGQDEIPDFLQQRPAQYQDVLKNTHRFQFIVYDIKSEAANKFTYKEFKEVQLTEPRWLYFDLNNFDGSPDVPAAQGDTSSKFYRTNFGDAQPDPDDANVFYLSHRGLGSLRYSETSNDIVRVRIVGNPREVDPKTGLPVALTSYMKFDRIYGFKGDETGDDKYPDTFLIKNYSGQKVVLMNNFRDLANFKKSRYTISAANLVDPSTPPTWFTQASSTDSDASYYTLSLANNGNLLTISFFDESLRLFNVELGQDIKFLKSIQ